jgi:hypothetical protein
MTEDMDKDESDMAYQISEAIEATATINAKMMEARPSVLIAALMVALVKTSFLYSKQGQEEHAMESLITAIRALHGEMQAGLRGTLQ